jgi:RimJ/RimL family protein N-acetyltransferase
VLEIERTFNTRKLLDRYLEPHWACWPEREASIALAKKLGFEEAQDVPAYYWREDL